MKRLMSMVVIAAATGGGGLMSAAMAEEAGAPPVQVVSFSQQLIPVLRTRCAVCHMTGTEPGHLRLFPSAAYDSIVEAESVSTGRRLVSAGQPDESYLLHKVKGTHLDVGGEGSRMPQGQESLSQEVITLIEAWIKQGAARN